MQLMLQATVCDCLAFEVAGQVVVLKQDAVFERLMPALEVPSRLVLELGGASSGDMRLSDHAARSMI